MKFKIGDKVRLKDSSCKLVEQGKVIQILKGGRYIRLNTCSCVIGGCLTCRFKKDSNFPNKLKIVKGLIK